MWNLEKSDMLLDKRRIKQLVHDHSNQILVGYPCVNIFKVKYVNFGSCFC